MRISRISIENFKRFDRLSIELENASTHEIASQFLILGDNGTGKSTVLQAIALSLAMASGKIRTPSALDWLGWMPQRLERWGSPAVEIEVHFSAQEIEATKEIAGRWYDAGIAPYGKFVEPGDSSVVRLRFDGQSVNADTPAELFQFRGRSYAVQLLKMKQDSRVREVMAGLPGVFWFDQFRNLVSTSARDEAGEFPSAEYSGVVNDNAARMMQFSGISHLRKYLVEWKTYQLSRGPRGKAPDFLSELETLYQQVFPGRKFGPLEPMYDNSPTPDGFYFTFDDGNRTYDIEEMSAGEQAIFPILYQIVRQRVSNSVVLIDEIDLNLHPPLAQMLLGSLPFWGNDNQFLFTTHSRAVSEVMDPNCICRLPGGRSCL